jgi:hypothetical protein
MKKILTTLAALVTLFAVVPYALALTKQFQVNTLSGGTLTTGLVSYWNMQGNSNDYWGTNNGTDTSVSYGTSYGKVAQGASFNGSNSTIVTNSFPGNTTWSVALWMKVTSNPSGRAGGSSAVGMTNGTNSGNFNIGVRIDGSAYLTFSTYNGGGGNTINGSYNMDDSAWHFVVATINSSTMTLYMDNSLVGSTSVTYSATWGGSVLSIGSNSWNSNSYFGTGDIDELGIWSKVLSTQEITDLYNGGAGQTMCNGTGGPLCGKHKIILISLNWKPEPIA